VRIGHWKRNVSLPIGLARLDVSDAHFEGDRLDVYFRIEAGQEPSPEELKPTRWQALRGRFSRERA
jgi:hypothetical protein